MTVSKLIGLCSLLFLLVACSASENDVFVPEIVKSDSPFPLEGEQARFYENIAYGEHELQRFDIFLPDSDQPTPLIIFIHGGGFSGGDKTAVYSESRRQEILETLSHGVAYATVNYRLLDEVDNEGVIKSLSDNRYALQFIRYYAKTFNIDKEQIALYGVSAGAGSALWIGLNDEMADQGSTADLIDDESTRVKAIGAIETQGSYDLVKWESEILTSVGVTLEIATTLGLEQRLLSFYGAADVDSVYNDPQIIAYRARVDMLALMSADDPDLWIRNYRIAAGFPAPDVDLVDWLFHHPLHAKALMDQADLIGISNVSYMPTMGIEDPSGEEVIPFLIRHIDY